MRRSGLSGVLLAVLSGTAFAQAPAGPEFQINTYTTGNQPAAYHAIAASAAGDFVVVWESAQGGTTFAELDIFGQRYDASGAGRGTEFRVNNYTTDGQWLPAVAADATGNFVVVWNSFGRDGSGEGVFAQRFERTGERRGAEFRVNTFTTGDQFRPVVASDSVGNFLVAWEYDAYPAATRSDVFVQLYDRGGQPRGAEFRVNTYTLFSQGEPAAAFDPEGNFVVVWVSGVQDGDETGVYAQRYTAAGVPRGGEFRVNTYTTREQARAKVAASAGGSFVVTWDSAIQDGDGSGVFAQRYDGAGTPQGPEFRVNSATFDEQYNPTVGTDRDGNFVVAWSDGDGAGVPPLDVIAKKYDSSGVPSGAEFRVNTWTTDTQAAPELAFDGAGNFVVAWQSFPGQDGSGVGVFGQRFGGIVQAPVVVDGGGNRVFEPGETVTVAPAWRNVSGQAQAFTGTASSFTGPGAPNPPYTINDASADYGVVPDGAVGSCTMTANCYSLTIGPVTLAAPTVRPVLHWDATFREDIAPATLGQSLVRTLHIGDSFTDVPRANVFYRFIETILHHNLTGGCGGGNFCPLAVTPREQMAVFVLVAKEGSGYQPPPCVAGSERFADVPASSPFCRWIEELARRSVAGGCGGGNFCPLSPVSREQMAVFALATKEAPGYSPVACVPGAEMFSDVSAASPFCRWVQELARRGIAGGCGGGNFCPISGVTRQENSVFIGGTFGLALY